MEPLRTKLERNLGWVLLVLLLLGCLAVMRPFLSALLWAIVLTFSCWPVYARLLLFLRGRRNVAAFIMALAMILILLLPFVIIGATLAESVSEIKAAVQHWTDAGPPDPPAWLLKVPVVGQQATEYWSSLAADTPKLVATLRTVFEQMTKPLLTTGRALGSGLFQLALSIMIAFFLFRDGAAAAQRLTTGVRRIAGERGQALLTVAGQTVRGVVYGILGTALVQAVMAGIGFLVARVPGAPLLALLTFFLSVIPVGPPLIWIPAALWLFNQGRPGWGVFMLIWGFGVSSVDNLVKPWIISHGSKMPFMLIFFGVIGGALAFGFIGVFLGPTLLAVGYRLLQEWFAQPTVAGPEPDAPTGTVA